MGYNSVRTDRGGIYEVEGLYCLSNENKGAD